MFLRSDRLFLRPCWPEDRNELTTVLGTALGASGRPCLTALWSGAEAARTFPAFLVTVPGHGIIGAAAILREASGRVAIVVGIAPSRLAGEYAAEAREALVPVARMLGHEVANHDDQVSRDSSACAGGTWGRRPSGRRERSARAGDGGGETCECYQMVKDEGRMAA